MKQDFEVNQSYLEQQQQYTEKLERSLEQAEMNRMQNETQQMQVSSFAGGRGEGIVELQLDLKEELDRIYHLLSGHQLSVTSEGHEIWVDAVDDRMRIFSDYGVKQIMNIISFYINRNTLLSRYDAETIKWKVKDFGIELSDLIFNRYEVFFYYPTPEELYDRYLPIMKAKGMDINETELYYKCMQWSEDELASRIAHFPMLCLAVVDAVHSTYLRALGGEERNSLRKMMHISQTSNQQQPMQQMHKSFSVFKPSTWGK